MVATPLARVAFTTGWLWFTSEAPRCRDVDSPGTTAGLRPPPEVLALLVVEIEDLVDLERCGLDILHDRDLVLRALEQLPYCSDGSRELQWRVDDLRVVLAA
jgi:hypothetical protein